MLNKIEELPIKIQPPPTNTIIEQLPHSEGINARRALFFLHLANQGENKHRVFFSIISQIFSLLYTTSKKMYIQLFLLYGLFCSEALELSMILHLSP